MTDQEKHFVPAAPEEVGVDPRGVAAFLEAAKEAQSGLHSLFIVKDGKAAVRGWAAPYEEKDKCHVFSISKSWTSTAVGFAVSEGLLKLDDKVISFFPDQCPDTISENLAKMEIRDLLRMGTGHHVDSSDFVVNGGPEWVKTFLSRPVEHEPGSYFVYDSCGTYMLSAIITKLTGKTLAEYLTPRLFEPMGMEGIYWDVSPEGANTGGWGIHVSVEDMAKLGYLYLCGGKVDEVQILPASWAKEATSYQIDNTPTNSAPDWRQGYGYQFWRCRHNCFRGDGAFGQYIVCVPEKKAVIAIQSCVKDMQKTLDLIWEYLLPALHDAPLAADPEGEKLLNTAIAGMKFPVPDGEGKAFSGSFGCGENPLGIGKITLNTQKDGGALTFTVGGEDYPVRFGTCGYETVCSCDGITKPFGQLVGGNYVKDVTSKLSSAGSWKGNVLTLQTVIRSTPFGVLFTLDTEAKTFAYALLDGTPEEKRESSVIPLA